MEDSQRDDWTPDPTERAEPESSDDRARRRCVEIAQDARFCMLTERGRRTGRCTRAR